VRAFDNWLKAYVAHQRYSESPTRFHFWTGVATVAGALRRRVWIDMKIFQWTPNFFIILVGPPGTAKKSTTIRQGLYLLNHVKGIRFGPQSLTWQALLEALAEAQEGVELPGKAKPEIMSCLTVGVSELGNFLRPDNREFMDFLIEMWDGQKGTFSRRTVMRGQQEILHPWLNLIGCTTPAWLKDNFPEIMIGGGLTSRVVFVYGDRKRQLVAYPGLEVPGPDYDREEALLIRDLQLISMLKGQCNLTPDAIEWGESWYEEHNTKSRPTHLNSERFAGYLDRKQTHIHKLAIVLSAAQRNDLKITADDLIEACAHITDLETDMVNVFASIGVSPTAKINGELLSLIRNAGSIGHRELWQQCFRSIALKDFQDGIHAVVNAGYARLEPRVLPDGTKNPLLVALHVPDPTAPADDLPPLDSSPESSGTLG
jgi:hypothetical protein